MENLVIPCNLKLPVPTIPIKSALFPSESPSKRTVSFSAEIRSRVSDSHLDSLCKKGLLSDAVSALESIAVSGSKVNPGTYMNLLQSCIDTNRIELGREIHARLSLVEDINPFVETKLVSMYAKCGYLDDARRVFDGMRERNLFTWSAMIGAFSRKQRWKDVFELFLMMVRDGVVPDRFLLPKILEACGSLRDLEATKVIHSMVIRCGFTESVRVSNSILSVYTKCGKLNSAKKLLNTMEKRDAVSWNSIISGFFQKGRVEEATRLFDQMREEGTEPGLVTWNIMIAGYNQSGETDIAMGLMKKMESLGISPDVFTWTSMISGLAHNNRRTQALELFKEMISEEVEPNAITIASAISASASARSLPKGMEIHAVAFKLGLAGEVLVGNSLVDMYCKCGDLDSAQRVFDETAERRDVYTWNTMIGGFCQAGYCGRAFELFAKMEESKSTVAPNAITWNVMISGYIQNGDEDRAVDLFQRMEEGGKVKRNAATWNALVAGYLSLGEKDKALSVLRQMSSNGAVPNLVTVLSVLPACANLVSANKVREIHCSVLRRGLESEISVVNSLLDTYSKSGNLIYSRAVFDRIHQRDAISWNSIISGYVFHSHPNIALELYDRMKRSRLKPNRGTFLSVIYACALSGVVNIGKREFSSMSRDYHIVPGQEHYSAMVDLFGRKGRLGEAMEFVENMPTRPESSVWWSLLTASRVHRKPGFAILALDSLLELDPGNYSIQRLRLQADDQRARIKQLELESGPAKRHLGRSWIELENRVYTFFAGDESEPYLNPWIREITEKVACQSRTGFRDGAWLEEEEREDIGGFHSEKIAIGFALIGFPRKMQCLRIVKSLRMCGNCHETAKYVSKLYGCEIYVSDSKCLHRFSDGQCSCGDYW